MKLLVGDGAHQGLVGLAGGLRVVSAWTYKVDEAGPIGIEAGEEAVGGPVSLRVAPWRLGVIERP